MINVPCLEAQRKRCRHSAILAGSEYALIVISLMPSPFFQTLYVSFLHCRMMPNPYSHHLRPRVRWMNESDSSQDC